MKNLLICIIILFAIFTSCKNNNNNTTDKTLSKYDIMLKAQIEEIKNKEVKSLISILDSTTKISNKTIFLYNGFDCQTCIDIGFEISKMIDSVLNKQVVYIISTSANVGQDQLKNNYKKYVYIDEKDVIRKELKFIYTPVFLSFDFENKIKNVFFPNYKNRNLKEEKAFIRSCIEKENKKSKLNNTIP
ncbi:hypothetical protein L3049_07905 [Labilibaculum sp. DW002]|uniref:Thioredoxin-like fold domain-containing protein n=1 Tax=Paralabilibaculum antarcticum TaxID=2912572 RepID=A0ABT5VUI2_9BACT|nr:hypothetical protein [Labilibaculum sp. DW002]MDE5417929.1 hypothetical protein [Labilibaculum sp. DW002]